MVNGKSFAALGAPALQNELTGFRLHPLPEPMLLGTPSVVRLKGALGHTLVLAPQKTFNLAPA